MPNIYRSVNNFVHDNLATGKASHTVYVVSNDLRKNEPKSKRYDVTSVTAECSSLVTSVVYKFIQGECIKMQTKNKLLLKETKATRWRKFCTYMRSTHNLGYF